MPEYLQTFDDLPLALFKRLEILFIIVTEMTKIRTPHHCHLVAAAPISIGYSNTEARFRGTL